jgi:thioredoxin 2
MQRDPAMPEGTIVSCTSCGKKNRVPGSAAGKPQCAACKTPLPWIVDATDQTMVSALDTKQLVLIDLWAPWCGPCRMVAPVLEQLASKYAGRIKVVKVNVDDNPRTAQTYDARSIPTLVFAKDGAVVDRIIGAQPAPALSSRIDALLAS